jgi:hypothetical protein
MRLDIENHKTSWGVVAQERRGPIHPQAHPVIRFPLAFCQVQPTAEPDNSSDKPPKTVQKTNVHLNTLSIKLLIVFLKQ